MSRPAPVVEAHANLVSHPILLGVSLKLYLDLAQTTRWAREVSVIAGSHPAVLSGAVELFALPSLPALPAVRDELAGTQVRIGAQDLHWADRGPFTGAISGEDLKAIGCSFVEIGHAERRELFGETDQVVAEKLAAAFRNNLVPILCVGERETLSARTAAAVCIAQVESALAASDISAAEIIVAYEPVWAIGQAKPASASHVSEVSAALSEHLARDERFSASKVIYGGSAGPGTLTELGTGIDGLFLGRFAHDPGEFARIIEEAAALR